MAAIAASSSPSLNHRSTPNGSQSLEPSTGRGYPNFSSPNGDLPRSVTPGSDVGNGGDGAALFQGAPDEDFPEPFCGGCKKLIDEDSADAGVIHFATQLWHVDCFRCAKCKSLVTTDRDDILLLSDGHPICAQCNYSCQICGLPIMEEAIMTGEESYHASCFTCRSCREPIEELVFAKTSQGIYCMNCHNQRVARSRRHAEAKRAKGQGGSSSKSRKASEGGQSQQSPAPEPMTPSIENGLSKPQPPKPASPDRGMAPQSSSAPGTPQAATTHHQQQYPYQLTGEQASSSSSLSPFPASGSRGMSAASRPGSAGQGSGKRPLAAPTPPSLRELRGGAKRPSTGDLAADRLPQSDLVKSSPSLTSQTKRLDDGTPLATSDTSPAELGYNGSPLLAGFEGARNQQQDKERKRDIAVASDALSGRTRGLSNTKPTRALHGLGIADEVAAVKDSQDTTITPSISIDREGGSSEDLDSTRDAVAANVQLKRASRLGVITDKSLKRSSRALSFYDPDIVRLMESFNTFESSKELSLQMPTKTIDDTESPQLPAKASEGNDEGGEDRKKLEESGQLLPQDGQEQQQQKQQTGTLGEKEEEEEEEGEEEQGTAASLNKLTARMRQSMKQARDGHVSMDTSFVETILSDLDSTRQRMKVLQRKYDKIRRASQQAAHSFSSAREEYETEVQARYDAEMEMLTLKKRLAEQATKLAELTSEKRQHENMQRKSNSVRENIEDMTREMAKLTMERDLTVAEVAELVAMQDGKSLQDEAVTAPAKETRSNIQRNLTLRLEGVKERYRKEIDQLISQRDDLLGEIEELKQSRDVFNEEAQALNARNEELNGILAHLLRRVETAQAQSKTSLPQQSRQQTQQQQAAALQNKSGANGFGFGFGKQSKLPGHAPSVASMSTDSTTLPGELNGRLSDATPDLAVQRAAPVPVTKVETGPKKFKWMKAPKLTDTARTAGQNVASALSGVSPPVPPKHDEEAIGTMQQQQLQQLQVQQQQQLHQQQQHQQQQSQQQSLQAQQQRQAQENVQSNGSGANGASGSRSDAGEIVVREHSFFPLNIIRPVRCLACQKNMWGQSEYRCSSCGQACHHRCLQSLSISCMQPYTKTDEHMEPAGPSMFGKALSEQAKHEGRDVPLVVEKCVQAVEAMGMDYEGIYRKSGGSSQMRVITQLFDRGQPFDLEDMDRFNDISAITSVLKNYFRELPEPLLTFKLYDRFIEASENKGRDEASKESTMRDIVAALPYEHRKTLQYLVLHLARVQLRLTENRMNARNLGVVFGPTLMRSSDPNQDFSHMGGKAMTIEFMIDHPRIFD